MQKSFVQKCVFIQLVGIFSLFLKPVVYFFCLQETGSSRILICMIQAHSHIVFITISFNVILI
jgi:hypothetical protein